MTESFTSPIFLLKTVELVLSIICALLLGGILPSDSVWQIEFTHATVYGFILINLIIVVAFIFDEPLSTRMRIIISGIGTIFYVVSAVILIAFYMGNSTSMRIIVTGFIALINTIVFGADCFFTSKYLE